MERKRIYSDAEIDEALEIVKKRTMEVIRILGNRANLIAYMIDPACVAIGASLKANEDVFENALWKNVINRKNLAFDGNAGYTLIDLAKMIKNGEI